ncbi:MAG: DUF3299 domain-containing protein [Rubrivivax sp.]|nr:DUF3299 domain-containing protein [Rubrivivax sp.]
MQRRSLLRALPLLALPAAPGLRAQLAGVPAMKPPLAGAPAAGAARTITWEDLVPRDWDPFKDFKDLNFQMLDDGDPRAMELLKRMRKVWDEAPVNEALAGQLIRLPGFIVPLEDSREGLKEFLLVPYFGACIHSPPPPANQIIHVVPARPARGLRSMDAVWVSGPLALDRVDSHMGMAGYRIAATEVAPYKETGRR